MKKLFEMSINEINNLYNELKSRGMTTEEIKNYLEKEVI